jgi:hypothetical protein
MNRTLATFLPETETNKKIFIRIRFDSTEVLKISSRFGSIRSLLYSIRFDSSSLLKFKFGFGSIRIDSDHDRKRYLCFPVLLIKIEWLVYDLYTFTNTYKIDMNDFDPSTARTFFYMYVSQLQIYGTVFVSVLGEWIKHPHPPILHHFYFLSKLRLPRIQYRDLIYVCILFYADRYFFINLTLLFFK